MHCVPDARVFDYSTNRIRTRRPMKPKVVKGETIKAEDTISLAEEADEYLTVEEDQVAAMRLQIEEQEKEIRELKNSKHLLEIRLDTAKNGCRAKFFKLQKLNQDYALCEERLFTQDSMIRTLQADVRRQEREGEEKDREIARLEEKLSKLTVRKRTTSSLFPFFSRARGQDDQEEDDFPKSI
ncbi:hypothetical protein QR680_011960 [Steinernema hermaphroditum]|uniref:Uncharacterized protein n=1 Tax=Steinernema hermaphroditum TaxID=289476 RepID=A0AA39LZP1_9BILA|nr:hypothetical protein QR680_011960 [Steinernema hermaphroditum]